MENLNSWYSLNSSYQIRSCRDTSEENLKEVRVLGMTVSPKHVHWRRERRGFRTRSSHRSFFCVCDSRKAKRAERSRTTPTLDLFREALPSSRVSLEDMQDWTSMVPSAAFR